MTINFSLDSRLNGSPFVHYWEHCVGSCHAIMGTRQDWREQLEKKPPRTRLSICSFSRLTE